MIVQLTAEQATRQWEFLSWSIMQALPPTVKSNPNLKNNLLSAILTGKLLCWVIFRVIDGKSRVVAVGTTTEVGDLAGTKDLLIYTLHGQLPIESEEWIDALAQLKKWAQHCGCSRVTTYTANPIVVGKMEDLGWDTRCVYATIEAGGD